VGEGSISTKLYLCHDAFEHHEVWTEPQFSLKTVCPTLQTACMQRISPPLFFLAEIMSGRDSCLAWAAVLAFQIRQVDGEDLFSTHGSNMGISLSHEKINTQETSATHHRRSESGTPQEIREFQYTTSDTGLNLSICLPCWA